MSITGKFREGNADATDVLDAVQRLGGGKVDTPALSSPELAWAHGVECAGGNLLPPVQGRKGQHYHQSHCQPKRHLKETQKRLLFRQKVTSISSLTVSIGRISLKMLNKGLENTYIATRNKNPQNATNSTQHHVTGTKTHDIYRFYTLLHSLHYCNSWHLLSVLLLFCVILYYHPTENSNQ